MREGSDVGDTARNVGAAGAGVAGAGTALAATALAGCCVTPVVSTLLVGLLGAGGAAAAAALDPWTPYLLAGSLLSIAFGFRQAYRGPACGRGRRSARVVLWVSAALWLASLTTVLWLR